jgi:hypothetical protein
MQKIAAIIALFLGTALVISLSESNPAALDCIAVVGMVFGIGLYWRGKQPLPMKLAYTVFWFCLMLALYDVVDTDFISLMLGVQIGVALTVWYYERK